MHYQLQSINFSNLKVLLTDYNKIQSYGFTREVVDLEPLREKWSSFGFDVSESKRT